MKFKDRFDKSSRAWRRGVCIVSEKSGPLTLRPLLSENHVTLSATAVNPDCFDAFELSLRYQFDGADNGRISIGFGKRHEWSAHAEATLKIDIGCDGTMQVFGAGDSRQRAIDLPECGNSMLDLKIKKDSNGLTLSLGGTKQSFDLPKNLKTSGYFSILADDVAIQLHACDIASPLDIEPLTESHRDEDIAAWKRWRMDCNHRTLKEIQAKAQRDIRDGTWGYKADFSVERGLVNVGEETVVTFRYRGDPGEAMVTVEANYLSDHGREPQPVTLNWQQREDGICVATHSIVADMPGNWRIVWEVDGERLTRVFGVVEQGYTVCTLWVGSNVPDVDREIHEYDLPGDYWVGDWWSPFDKAPEAVLDYFRKYADFRHRHGDVLVPFVNASWILPGIPNFNLFEVESDLQAEGFGLIRDVMAALEVGPLALMGSYTMGHDTPAAAAKAGIKGLTSMCVWQNWLDGSDDNHWKINHWGAPIVPYYMADDDFRKVGPGQSVIGFNMGTASSIRNYSIFCFECSPTNTVPMQRYASQGVLSENMHRFHYAVDGWLHDAKNNDQPLFVTVALENFGGREDWQRANKMGVEYLVKKAKTEKIVFASAAHIADYYLENYDVQPEHVFYQPDVYCGLKPDVKPALLPDRIEYSNHLFHSVHVDGQSLPQVLWDFTLGWDNPVWDDLAEIRVANGLITPEDGVEHGYVPKGVDLRDADVAVTTNTRSGIVEVAVVVNLRHPLRSLPIALWRLPLMAEGVRVRCDLENVRWLSVVDSFTRNHNGLIICNDLPAGESRIHLEFEGESLAPDLCDFMIGDSVFCRELILDGKSCVYTWLGEGCESASLAIPDLANTPVYAVGVDGEAYKPDVQGKISMQFDGHWQRESYIVVNADRQTLDAAEITPLRVPCTSV